MIPVKGFAFFLCTLLFLEVKAQSIDSTFIKKEYTNIEEALENPSLVYRLNLSNQKIQLSDSIWSKFQNLQYLSLKNDHLKTLPEGIGYLKNLKVLDLSGNDFKVLPPTFSGLLNLQELYLNDDKNLQFDKSIDVLCTLTNLKSLHLEDDGLKKLPDNFIQLKNLESLYLNNNQFKDFPLEIKELHHLQYLDIHENKFALPNKQNQEPGFGLKIRF